MGLSATCRECEVNQPLGPHKCVLVLYSKQLYMSYLRIVCENPECGQHELDEDGGEYWQPTVWYTFLSPDADEARHKVTLILKQGWPIQPGETAPEWVVREYEEHVGFELEKVHDLTPRHEELIQALRFTLENTPDEHLMDIFSSPPPKSDLPRRWTE